MWVLHCVVIVAEKYKKIKEKGANKNKGMTTMLCYSNNRLGCKSLSQGPKDEKEEEGGLSAKRQNT